MKTLTFRKTVNSYGTAWEVNMYKGGYTGKILRINLTDQLSTIEDLPYEMAVNYMGGSGFGIKYIYDEVDAEIDPLGPENKLVFAPGPFTGTDIPCASRMAITAKSPQTNTIAVALSGGYFPAELKLAGFDALIIEGVAAEPTYLWINEGKVQFKKGKPVWGTTTFDCQQIIKDTLHDQKVRIACIGPAGENLSRMAGIFNERRAAGRKGLGAVMGAKKLKAIAIRGDTPLNIASKEKYTIARRQMMNAMKESPVLYSEFAKVGTPSNVDNTCGLGIFPAKNWSETGVFEPVNEIGIEQMMTRNIGREACYKCPVGCSQLNLAQTGRYKGTMSEGPEFETMYSFGGATGVDKVDAIIHADRIADELGLDSISSGVTIAFAMELYEKGILTRDDTDGIELKFGNDEAMSLLLQKMSYREGIGAILADGVKIAAEKIGKGSEKYAMHVKSLELPAYDVRGAKAHGLNYATSYCGADHNKGYAFQEIFDIPIPHPVDRWSVEGKGKLTKWNQDIRTVTCDCATMCAFLLDMAVPHIATKNTADLLEAVTGISLSEEEIEKIGERVLNLARAFNVKAGFSRKDDDLPLRLKTEPLKSGSSKGQVFSQKDLDYMLDEYYTERGWDVKTGVPLRAKLVSLNLEHVADQLGT